MVIQAAIDQWLASEKGQCEDSTHQTYRYTLSVFQTFLAQHHPSITVAHELTLPLLHAYIHYLKETRRLADRTLHTYVHVVARWLTDLINDGELVIQSERGNVLTPDGVRKRLQRKLPSLEAPVAPRIPDLRRLPLYYDDLRTALLNQRGGQIPPPTDVPGYRTYLNLLRNQALIEVLFATGCRIKEVLDLDRLDVVHAGAIRDEVMVEGKGRKKRTIYFDAAAQSDLKTYLMARRALFPQAAALFISHGPRSAGQRLSDVSAWRIVKEAAEALADIREHEGADTAEVRSLRKVSPHTFRHFFAQEMLDDGADLRRTSRALGHSSTKVTEQFYADPKPQQVRDDVERHRPKRERS
jgi:site-specific recombinase XerD